MNYNENRLRFCVLANYEFENYVVSVKNYSLTKKSVKSATAGIEVGALARNDVEYWHIVS